MSDLIKQLRYAAQGELFGDTLLEEAADRIEQLEAKLANFGGRVQSDVYVLSLLTKIDELEAKLDAVQPLPDKWRKYTFDNPEATSYIDSADCADELEEALGEAK